MNKKLRKEIIEWVLLIGFLLILFYTPLGTTISTTLQRGLLATGLIRPDISEKEEAVIADFNFELMDINGNSVPFSTFQGKVIFVNFWATWCAPCIAEMPDINELHQIFEQDENIKFVLISVDRDFEKAQRFMKEKSFNLPLYRLKTGLPDVYNTSSIPTTYVINPEGKIVVERHGIAQYNSDAFIQFLRELQSE